MTVRHQTCNAWCKGARLVTLLIASVIMVTACGDSKPVNSGASTQELVVVRSANSQTAAELFAMIAPSLVYVEVPDGTGSGVLIADGYVVTSAHVVGHYPTVRLVTSAGELNEVPVYAKDWSTDLALVGPLPADQLEEKIPALDLGTSAEVAVGDNVYLIGYPGEVESRPEPTMTAGILSRRRQEACLGMTFLQTDAVIAGGQSGGALVDAAGRLIGISGLGGFADAFALVHTAEEVATALKNLGEGDGNLVMSEILGSPIQTVEVRPTDSAGFVVEVTDEQPWLSVTAKSLDREDVYVQITNWAGDEPVWRFLDGEVDYVYDTFESDEEASPFYADIFDNGGAETLEVPLEPGMYVVATGSFSAMSTTIEVRASAPLAQLQDAEPHNRTLGMGDIVTGLLSFNSDIDTYRVDLRKGEVARMQIVSLGDPVMSLYWRNTLVASNDDAGIGLYGDGSEIVFEAPRTDLYELDVTAVGEFPATYVLKLDPDVAAIPSC